MQAYMYKKDKENWRDYPPPHMAIFLFRIQDGVGSGIKRVGIRVFES